jgi:GT2 family glycosyltransferase
MSADWESRIAVARNAARPIASELTLVIPTLGRPILAECLAALLEGTMWPAAVIVVDQGASTQIAGWLDDLRDLGIRARHEPCAGRGRALGLNAGLRLVRTRFVVITDDDCLPDAGWIEGYAAHLRAEPHTVFTGAVAAAGEERVLNVVSGRQPSITRKPGWSFDRLSGGNCGMAVEVLRTVGLFDPDPCMRFAEDGEWAFRALRAGVPIAYAPELLVAHVGWRELDDRLDQYRGYARSHAAFFGKHLRRGDLFMVLRAKVHLARALRRWLRGRLRGDRELAANGRSYAMQLVPGIIAGMKSRLRPPALRNAAPGTLIASGKPAIAVAILSFNQREQTLRCLRHLLELTPAEGPFDVLLWDNGSKDGTATAVAEAFPRVLVEACPESLGVAGGRNAAAKLAIERFEPEFLLFLDNDIVVQPGFVRSLVEAFHAPGGERIGQVQAKLRLADEPERLNDGGGCRIQFWLGRTRPVGYGEIDQGQRDTPAPCVACGGAMMVRAGLFRELGGFDEAFSPFGPEDLDFSLRLQEDGWEAWYVPAAMGFHDVNHTFGAAGYSEDYARHRAKHWMELMRRHASPLDWLGFVFIGVPLIAGRVLVREVRKGNLGALRGLVRGALGRPKRQNRG